MAYPEITWHWEDGLTSPDGCVEATANTARSVTVEIDSTTVFVDGHETIKYTVPVGFPDGNIVGQYFCPKAIVGCVNSDQLELYFRFSFKYDSSWDFHPVTDKLMFARPFPDSGGAGNYFLQRHGPSGGLLRFDNQGPTQVRTANENLPAPTIDLGKEYWVEIHTIMNSPATASNGVLEVWMSNGDTFDMPRIMNYSDVQFQDETDINLPLGWGNVRGEFLWGGDVPQETTQQMICWAGTVVISNSRIGAPTAPAPDVEVPFSGVTDCFVVPSYGRF